MGSSRDIAIGPVAVESLLLGSLVQNEVDYKTDADDYLRLMLTATFFAGVTQLTLGFKSDLHFPSVKVVLSCQAKGI
ncbi:hypothetical protein FF1_019053 [Malus domestica]